MPGPRTQTPQEAFDRRVQRGAPDECWGWSGTIDENGYTQVNIDHRRWYGHRLAFFLATGELPEHVHHRCQNHGCVNPAHLEAQTNSDHQYLHWSQRDRTIVFDDTAEACPRGHDPKYMRWYMSTGKRVRRVKNCLACKREQRAARSHG